MRPSFSPTAAPRNAAQWIDAAMASLAYVPNRSTLLVLFKAARVRLMTACERVDFLPESSLALFTEAINRLSDEIREASAGSSIHDDAALLAGQLKEEARHHRNDGDVRSLSDRR
jgi:hypothetical protein